jgi:hypothetical protein
MPLPRVDLNLELALVRRIGILAVLGAADLLGNTFHAGNGDEAFRDLLTYARGFGERYPRPQRCMGDQVVFAEIGQQTRTEQWQANDSRDAADDQNGDERARPEMKPGDRAQLPALQSL